MKKRLIKIFIIELIIVSLLFLIILNKEFKFTNETVPSMDSVMDDININSDIDNDIEHKIDSNINKGENEKDIVYERIRDGLLEGKDIIKVDDKILGENREDFFDIVEEVLLDNPEIMYYTSGKYSNNTFYPSYNMSIKEKQLQQKAIREKRDYIIHEIIDENMSQYEKIKAVHDYIIKNTKYDTRHFSSEKIPNESYTVYGVLFEGIAVCEGYAKTMKYLLDEVGIETKIVIGRGNGENHAWNIVNIDGDYYHIDATWDDPTTEDGTNILIYDYFNLMDSEIEKTHSWDRDKYPLCNSNKYNYYYYNGLVIDNYAEFYGKIVDALINDRSEISLKVLNYDEEHYNISTTMDKIAINNSSIINISRYAYSINSNQNIVKIYFYK
jgi:hypothetical protein